MTSNNFKDLEEAKERFKHLPEPDSGWYFKYAPHSMSERKVIVAASLLGKWCMHCYDLSTLGQVRDFLARYFRTGEEPNDAKLKDFMLIVWGEKNHNQIERESDVKLRRLLARQYHQNIRPGDYDYFKEFGIESLG